MYLVSQNLLMMLSKDFLHQDFKCQLSVSLSPLDEQDYYKTNQILSDYGSRNSIQPLKQGITILSSIEYYFIFILIISTNAEKQVINQDCI